MAEKFLQDLKQEPRIEGNVFVTSGKLASPVPWGCLTGSLHERCLLTRISDQLDAKFTEFKGNEGKMDRWVGQPPRECLFCRGGCRVADLV